MSATLVLKAFQLKFRFLCVLCVLGGFHLTAAALDREAFTFTRYNLEVHVDPRLQTLSVRGTVELRNDSPTPQKNAVLQISSALDWKSIAAGGKPVQYVDHEYTSDVDHTGSLSEAVVSLPSPVLPAHTVQLEIAYAGTVTRDATRLERMGTPRETALRTDWDQISADFTALRGAGYVCWYPVAMDAALLSEGSGYAETLGRWKAREAKSAMELRIFALPYVEMNDFPAGVRGAGAGGIADGSAKGFSYIAFNFNPLKDRVPTFFAANYKVLSQPHFGVHYLAEHEAAAKDYMSAAGAVRPLISEWFGERNSPVQTKDAGIFDLPYEDAAPYEANGLLFTPVRSAGSASLQIQLAHELAHSYFQSPRPWMDEGIAHFAQALEREQQAGREAAMAYMGNFLPPLVAAEKSPVTLPGAAPAELNSAGRALVASTDEIFYRTKAMYVWWMLRDMLGDKVLQRALAKYSAVEDTEPSYMQRLLQEEAKAAGASAANLETFFDDWVYRDRGLPDFRVASTYVRTMLGSGSSNPAGGQAEGYMLTVSVENLGNAGAQVPVTASAAGKDKSQARLLVPAHATASIRIPMRARPDRVAVNDGSVPESDMTNNSAFIPADQR